MTDLRTRVGAVGGTIVLVAGLSACGNQEGPAERAGKDIDRTVQSTGEQLEQAGQRIQDAAKAAKK